MNDVNEIRKTLETSLGEELRKKYYLLLQRWCCEQITKIDFESEIRKIMNAEQIRYHNRFIVAMYKKKYEPRTTVTSISTDEGFFELADYADFLQPLSIDCIPPAHLEYRTARSELFLPDSGFVKTRIAIYAWENKLEGVGDGVAELIVHASQTFAKNILTAMITRKQGYQIKDNKLQYGFGLPISDPFVKNSSTYKDTKEPHKLSAEEAQHRVAFLYSGSKRKRSDEKLTVQLLYETLRENPQVIGLHSIHSVNLFKLGLHLGE